MPVLKLKDTTGQPYEVTIYNNQKVIFIHRDRGIDFALNHYAMKKLTADAYLLYMYLITRPSNRVWTLSSQDVYNNTALKKRTYSKAVSELIEKKYLIPGPIDQIKLDLETYHLYECQQE